MLLDTKLPELERRAAALRLPDQAVIDGVCVDAACDTVDVDRAVAAARRAFENERWRDQCPRAMVNGWDACDITMPFGGFKQSGFGRDRSQHVLHKYADLKAISITLR